MNQKAFYAVILSAILAGFSGIFIKHLSIPATSIAWYRTAVPTIITAIWMLSQRVSFFRGNYKKMLGASVLNAIRMYLFFVAYIYTSIGNAVILFYTWPIFAAVLGNYKLKEKMSLRQGILLGLAFCGLIVAYSNKSFSFEDQDFIGMVAAVLSSLIYAMTVIIFKPETQNYHRLEIIFYQNVIGLVVFLPFFFFINPLPTMADNVIGLSYSFLIGIVGFNLFFYGLKKLKASIASALMYLEVVSAIILSYIWMGDQLSINMIIGGFMILLSSFFMNRIKT